MHGTMWINSVAVKHFLFIGQISGCRGGNRIGSFFRGLSRFVKPLLCFGAKAVGKEALKIGSNIITDSLNKEPEQPVGNILKNRFREAKSDIEEK